MTKKGILYFASLLILLAIYLAFFIFDKYILIRDFALLIASIMMVPFMLDLIFDDPFEFLKNNK